MEWVDTPSDHEAEILNQKTAIMDHKTESHMLFDCGSVTPKETFSITHGDVMNTAATKTLMREAFVVLLPKIPPEGAIKSTIFLNFIPSMECLQI